MKKVLDSLSLLLSLCEREKEWGGRVHLSTGEIEGPVEGEEGSFSLGTPKEERKKGNEGWAGFHSHPGNGIQEPSGSDLLIAHQRGTSEFVLTTRGVWEVKPIRVLSVKEVKHLDETAWAKAEAIESECGDLAYWMWVGLIRECLPIETTLVWKRGDIE